ncbi:HAD family hydrolase [Microaceticoccus formicicus]|uniref:HAD family hydrolase n=1 Tax=Microaceticoccus formicicus TaxID=3118105 RepID=UPI003CD033EA|nr:HAD-IB family hydrolase [Peptoniphilaceae bacterium AMB_02]
MKNKHIAAFFDIDGTLTRTSLMIDHFLRLVKNDVIEEHTWINEIKPLYDDYNRRYVDYDNYLDVVASVYMDTLKGIKYDFIDFIAQQVIKHNADIVYTYTRSQIKWHLEQGHLVFFISGSPNFLVKHIAKKYGVTDYRGTIYCLDEDDVFTGNFIKMWDSKSKLSMMTQFDKMYGIDFGKSYAYGDTNGDISMLERVGTAVAINPTNTLLEYIKNNDSLKKKVTIIVERKDVIYKITPDVETHKLV